MSNVHNLHATSDALIEGMKGPESVGNAVFIEGRHIPNTRMRDHGAEIEFILDDRYSFTFPREIALLAASFAAQSMAIGAGYQSLNAEDKNAPFAPQVMRIDAP